MAISSLVLGFFVIVITMAGLLVVNANLNKKRNSSDEAATLVKKSMKLSETYC